MKSQIKVKLNYTAQAPCTVLMQIAADDGNGQSLSDVRFDVTDQCDRRDLPGDAGIGTRSWLAITDRLQVSYQAQAIVTRPDPDWDALRTDSLHDLPSEAVTYLMSSRYCPADAFWGFLPGSFDGLTGGRLITALAAWITEHITYDNGASGPQTTAVDTFESRRGVCRDFAHLMIAFARCSAIPARMVSCYGPDVSPGDFHAVAEVWLCGGWHMIDATGMARASRLIRIGVGRDAADVAFLTAFGLLEMQTQSVEVTG